MWNSFKMKIEEIHRGDKGKPREGPTTRCDPTKVPLGGWIARCADVMWCQSLQGAEGQ